MASKPGTFDGHNLDQWWKFVLAALAVVGLYYGALQRVALLEERVINVQKTIDRQEGNIRGLEQFMMELGRD